jgi:hypothetical protein
MACVISPRVRIPEASHPLAMLTEMYIEVPAVDEELPDQLWEARKLGEIDNKKVFIAWWLIRFVQIRAKLPSCYRLDTIFHYFRARLPTLRDIRSSHN